MSFSLNEPEPKFSKQSTVRLQASLSI